MDEGECEIYSSQGTRLRKKVLQLKLNQYIRNYNDRVGNSFDSGGFISFQVHVNPITMNQ